MTNFIQRILTRLDIFGSNVGLNYNKNNVFQTSMGGIMSLCFCALIAVFFWNNVNTRTFSTRHFYDKVFTNTDAFYLYYKHVNSFTTQQYFNDPPVITLDATKYMFAVKIDQTNFIGQPLLNITFEPRVYVTYPNGTQIKIKSPTQLEQCTIEHFMKLPSNGVNWTQQFNQYTFNDYLCPPLNYNLTLGGNYNSARFAHWKFSVSKCSNSTPSTASWKPICPSTTYINNYFTQNQNVRFLMYMSNYVINPLQSSGYVSSYIDDQLIFSVQQNTAYTTADVYFTENVIQTDQSLIPFSDVQTESLPIYNNGNFKQQYVIGQTASTYADFFIRKDSMTYTYNRSFMKIGDILSYIGGFTQIFILICAILVNYYNEYVYSIALANEIYDFEFSSNNNKNNNNDSNKNGLNKKYEKSHFYKNSVNNNNNQNDISSKNLPYPAILNSNEFSHRQSPPLNNHQPSPLGRDEKKISLFEQYQKKGKYEDKVIEEEDVEERQNGGDQEVDSSSLSSTNQHTHTQQHRNTPNLDRNQISIEIPHFNKATKEQQDIQKKEREKQEKRQNKNRKITTREDEGLMSLDKLQSILQERRSYLEAKTRENDKTTTIKTATTNNQQQQHPSTLNEFKLETAQEDGKLKTKQKPIQKQSFSQNMRETMSQTQIDQKEIMNESISPESPMPQEDSKATPKTKQLLKEIHCNQKYEEDNQNVVEKGENISNRNQQQDKEQLKNKKPNQQQSGLQDSPKQDENQENQHNNNTIGQINGNQNQSILNADGTPTIALDALSCREINFFSSNQAILPQHQQAQRKESSTSQIDNLPQSFRSFSSPQQRGLFEGLGFRDKKQFLTKEFEFMLKRQKNVVMTFKFFLYKLTFGKFFRSEQVLLLEKAEKQMKDDLDIFMILNRIKELEKFKALFLDRNQEILFNFFPKPIISIQQNDQAISRREIIENIKKEQSQGKEGVKINSLQMKKLNLSFKTAILVQRAILRFKKPLMMKVNKFNTLSAYQKLYDAYEAIKSQGTENKFNTKLIELLGGEMNKILEISNLLEIQNFKKLQEQQSRNFDTCISPRKQQLQQQYQQQILTLSPRESYRNNSMNFQSGAHIGSGEFLNENANQQIVLDPPSISMREKSYSKKFNYQINPK